jgi:hypothetical protein
MAQMRARMIDPSINANPDFNTLEKRALMVGLVQMAEESGCLVLDPRAIRKAVFPLLPDITDEQVDEWINDFIADGVIWSYVAMDHATRCGYLPDWSRWNTNLTKFREPKEVPLPPGVMFIRYDEAKYPKLAHQGKYIRPASKAALEDFPAVNVNDYPGMIIPGITEHRDNTVLSP